MLESDRITWAGTLKFLVNMLQFMSQTDPISLINRLWTQRKLQTVTGGGDIVSFSSRWLDVLRLKEPQMSWVPGRPSVKELSGYPV